MSGVSPIGWLKGNDLQALSPEVRMKTIRQRLLAFVGGVLGAVAVAGGGWWICFASHYVSTENAYVAVSSASVTPLTSGTVIEVAVQNAQSVQKGDVVLRIDPADAQLAFEQAEAAYGLTIRKVEGYFAAVEARRADYERARLDYDRRVGLTRTGAVSGEELAGMKNAYNGAKAALDAAVAMTRGTDVAHHPEVLAAKAARNTAKLNLDRTVVRAPVNGIVTQRQIQVGQRVQAGEPVMTIVPVQQVYVDANYKESQLGHVRPGLPAELTSDYYGSSVVYHGRVAGVGGGTGAAFSVIPAQNATGNWIKVVQRVPVRITLDPAELAAHPLRVGLSMTATVDVSE
jgi:membrane fusion protein (multidrug efflux system)